MKKKLSGVAKPMEQFSQLPWGGVLSIQKEASKFAYI